MIMARIHSIVCFGCKTDCADWGDGASIDTVTILACSKFTDHGKHFPRVTDVCCFCCGAVMLLLYDTTARPARIRVEHVKSEIHSHVMTHV